MDKKLQIDKNTAIEDLIEENPEMNDVLYEYGLYCGNCFAAGWDTLEEGAKMHGLEDDEIEELIGELQRKADEAKNTAVVEKIEVKQE